MADTLGNTEEPNATMTEVVKSGDPKNGKDEVHDVLDDTTWMEVCQGCFCHSPIEWFWILFRLFWVLFFLFWFIVALGESTNETFSSFSLDENGIYPSKCFG